MSATVTLTIDPATKQGELSNVITLRETVVVTLSGATGGASDLRLALIDNGTVVATCNSFAIGYTGTLDLNTVELVAAFSGRSKTSLKNFNWVITDISTAAVLLNDRLPVQNNPLEPGMVDPTPVDPITVGDYALVANGVTNGDSHDHTGGAGGTISHANLIYKGTNSHQAIDDVISNKLAPGDLDGLRDSVCVTHLALQDDSSGYWFEVFIHGGTLAIGNRVIPSDPRPG